MAEPLEEENRETDLARMNLFVVPVTFRLLTEPCPAMDEDIAFALKQNIPILPVLWETGLEELYQIKFGDRQYLFPFSQDPTEIRYEEKLKNYLDSVLLSEEMAKRVRAAFDAYIFLSYRKKDRRYANELIRMIHADPVCRDIAVWFDEFLIPGESFKENIAHILQDSRLLALLVTPSLLETPNFVMDQEYPAARASGIPILPVEMKKTGRWQLKRKYRAIPRCLDMNRPDARQRFLESIRRYALQDSKDEPAHNYLMGLAYLNGIDVQTDAEQAVKLITSAAEKGLPEAMEKLWNMYFYGTSVKTDYQTSLYWMKKYAEYCEKQYGEDDPETLRVYHNIAATYNFMEEHGTALEIQQRIYDMSARRVGENDMATLLMLSNLGKTCLTLGRYQEALKKCTAAYYGLKKLLGKNDPHVIFAFQNLARCYDEMGDWTQAAALYEAQYKQCCDAQGEASDDAFSALSSLAACYRKQGNYDKSIALGEKYIRDSEQYCGKDHQRTLTARHDLALVLAEKGEKEKALTILREVYSTRCELQGEDHPETILALSNLSQTAFELGDKENAAKAFSRIYKWREERFGEDDPRTVRTLITLGVMLFSTTDKSQAIKISREAYEKAVRCFGAENPETLRAQYNLAFTLLDLQLYEEAIPLLEDSLEKAERKLGMQNPKYFLILQELLRADWMSGKQQKAKDLLERHYEHGVKDKMAAPETAVWIITNLAVLRRAGGNLSGAAALCRELDSYDPKLYEHFLKDREAILRESGNSGSPA
ncbi:MAG: tetratricopeptide repeat protein [Lachnospiraceae bacterium]|nr:tetratricopeptide repeat protein [Lachnospiraceae bacterium]